MTKSNTILPSNVVRPLGVSRLGNQTALLYQSKRRGHSKLGLASTRGGLDFVESLDPPVLMNNQSRSIDISTVKYAQVSEVSHQRVVVFSTGDRLQTAIASDLHGLGIELWTVNKKTLPRADSGCVVSEFKHNNQYVLYYSRGNICVSFSRDLQNWHGPNQPLVKKRVDSFDRATLRVFASQHIEQGILVLYQSNFQHKKKSTANIGAVLFDRSDPTKIIWRSSKPLWQIQSRRFDETNILGADITDQTLVIYANSKSGGVFVVNLANPLAGSRMKVRGLRLSRHRANPIIAPEGGGPWEAIGTFNPAIIQEDNKIHIMYRALDISGISRIGYANSHDGITIAERQTEPAYWPREAFEAGQTPTAYSQWSDQFGSGGGWGGCEDPKLTLIDNKVYLTYVAHSGWGPPRLAMSSIRLDDFRNKRWQNWSKARLISEPGVVNKSGIILPEKINGKYVIFHRVFPDILVHYTDDLENLGTSEWLQAHDSIPTREDSWDSRKLSMGSTPIRIDEGWLVIYHAVDDSDDNKYKIGAMILDSDNPAKVIARTNQPILEPETHYENEWKYGIAYPSGAAIINDTLHVYYGGGDRHVCVATAPLKQFVTNLLKHKQVQLESPHAID